MAEPLISPAPARHDPYGAAETFPEFDCETSTGQTVCLSGAVILTSAVGPFLTVGPDHLPPSGDQAWLRRAAPVADRAGYSLAASPARSTRPASPSPRRPASVMLVGDGEGENQLPLADCEVRGVAADRER